MAFSYMTQKIMAVAIFASSMTSGESIAVCPGESDRYGDRKCNHDETHRVCAQLLDKSGQPISWGSGDFWQITGQEAFKWDADIRANGGDSWCICMWATATLIKKVGCSNVHLHCDSTDTSYVLGKYNDGGVDLKAAHDCLKQKCPNVAAALVQEHDNAGYAEQ
eukprot:TRINITY_DN2205_c0_g1_i2.p2 TRINITY_DN2205_c0_g1~~TRINITY_DN2205_c0_g1_i2.p2  ORF type:complete len:164 (-),score=39.24 TRINITY_DN2205_c0_g1_i2:281-772(-)